MTPKALADKIRKHRPRDLAKAITLAESTKPSDLAVADEVLAILLKDPAPCLKIGISGIPGVGKSTFIEALGEAILAKDPHSRIGILTVDPSSPISGGSIMGDRTRMTGLSAHPQVFIRPSPNKDAIGGIGKRSREVVQLLAAGGYSTILVETTGVGQSEYLVAGMVDVFLLLQMPATGDELQDAKKGILELADLIVINKADAQMKDAALATFSQQRASFARKHQAHTWNTPVLLASALERTGIAEIWDTIQSFVAFQKSQERFAERRRLQDSLWFKEAFVEEMIRLYFQKIAATWNPNQIHNPRDAKKYAEELFMKQHASVSDKSNTL